MALSCVWCELAYCHMHACMVCCFSVDVPNDPMCSLHWRMLFLFCIVVMSLYRSCHGASGLGWIVLRYACVLTGTACSWISGC